MPCTHLAQIWENFDFIEILLVSFVSILLTRIVVETYLLSCAFIQM